MTEDKPFEFRRRRRDEDDIAERIRNIVFEYHLHPDYVIIAIIRKIYGHEIDEAKLVELIEGSKLADY